MTKDKPIHLADVEREARRKIDWTRVHIEADKRKPFGFLPNVGSWVSPTSRNAGKKN